MVGQKRASYDVWSGIGSKFHSSDAADGLRTRAETFMRFHKRGNVLISTGICLAFSLDPAIVKISLVFKGQMWHLDLFTFAIAAINHWEQQRAKHT